MDKSLIVAEKPSVAADIAKALGGFTKGNGCYERDDAIVAPARGHLVELTVPEADAKEAWKLPSLPVIPGAFTLEVIDGCSNEFNTLKKLMNRDDVKNIVNACDAGREGELIFRLIYRMARSSKPIERMWMQSMVASAIRKAYDTMRPGAEFDNLHDAALCRAEADWIIGINGTRATTAFRERQTQRSEVSTVGRVQTPTLAMPVMREREIAAFVSQDYWEIHGTFRAAAGIYTAKWINEDEGGESDEQAGSRFFDKEKAQQLVAKCNGVTPSSVIDESKPESREAPALFDLTTLQREANKRFKFSAKKTQDIAQALYEKHKATTYPRTDSTALPEDYLETATATLSSFAGTSLADYAQRIIDGGWVRHDKRIFNDAEISDHFAIVPTGQQPQDLSADEQKIYDLVSRRFIAVFYPPAKYEKTVRTTVVAEEKFCTSGRVLLDAGWLAVYGNKSEGSNDTPVLCKVEPDEVISNEKIELKALRTKPPKRYTEDTLLSAMEHAGRQVDDKDIRAIMKSTGLGRPAIRASIIEGLLEDRDRKGNPKEPYLVRNEEELVPTPKAMALIGFLEENGIAFLVSPKMTGEWEQKLLQMERGEYGRSAFMSEIADVSTGMVNIIRAKVDTLPVPLAKQLATPCRKCSATINVNGRVYECSGCGFKLWSEVAGRRLSDAEVETLLKDGKTAVLSGFTSRLNKKFSAKLRLNEEAGKVEFEFEDRAASAGVEAKRLTATCPITTCGSSIVVQGKAYACTGCDFKVWSEIAERKLSPAEAEVLIGKGHTGLLTGFKSKVGRKFSAKLKLNAETGKVNFEFEDRVKNIAI